jgi:hypothetical protein
VDDNKTDELIRDLEEGRDGGGKLNNEELEQIKREIEKVEIEVQEAKRFKIN